MEPATAGALYAAENLLQGAAALVKGVAHPTLPVKLHLSHITSVQLPRSHHTLSVVKGRAYVFGGECQPGRFADNDMHVIILPSSGVEEADYTIFPAKSSSKSGDVPNARKGHTSVVIGDNIYVFGGELEGGIQDEKGRVWIYHTVPNTWSYLDPTPDKLYPCARSGHGSAGSDLPGPETTRYREKAPQAPADPATVVPKPAEPDSWGTLFVAGGRDMSQGLLNDVLAFDIKSRTWSNMPSLPAQPRDGASVTVVGNNLYRFGGLAAETAAASDATEWLDVSSVWKHAGGSTSSSTNDWKWQAVSHASKKNGRVIKPPARAHAGVVGVTTGQGRHYLLAIGGQTESGVFHDDVWSLQLPPERSTAAASKDKIRASIKRDTHELEWAEVLYKYKAQESEEKEKEKDSTKPVKGIGARSHFAVAKGKEIDGAMAVVWGGVDARGMVLEDGWMATVER